MSIEDNSDLAVLAKALKAVLRIDLNPADEKDRDELRARARQLADSPDSTETEAILDYLAVKQPVMEPAQSASEETCTLKRSTRQVPEHLNYMHRGKAYPRSPENDQDLKP